MKKLIIKNVAYIKILGVLFLAITIFLAACKQNTNRQIGDEFGVPMAQFDTNNYINNTSNWPVSFGYGKTADKELIKRLNISIKPDGRGLPDGGARAMEGEAVFINKCAACHGKNGVEGVYDHLVFSDTSKARTIGNYWPYSTTLFDYIRRAMPYNQPGSLSNDEVYQLTAYLLYKNKIIDEKMLIDAQSLPKIIMPAKKQYVDDNRKPGPEVH